MIAKKVPWLVQRVNRRDAPRPGAKGLDLVFAFDYMGSAEFEFGALPKAVKEMRAQKDKLTIVSFKHGDYHCTFLGRTEDAELAKEFFVDQLNEPNHKIRLQEPSFIGQTYRTERHFAEYIGWWAIDQECPWVIFKNKRDAYAWKEAL